MRDLVATLLVLLGCLVGLWVAIHIMFVNGIVMAGEGFLEHNLSKIAWGIVRVISFSAAGVLSAIPFFLLAKKVGK